MNTTWNIIQVFFLTILNCSSETIFTTGDRTSMTKYRPISLSTVFYKVFEKAMYSRLSQHLHTNNSMVLGNEYQLKMLLQTNK